MVKDLKSGEFAQEVINSNETVVVDMWAPWCGPCKMLGPVLHEVADEMEGKASFFKLNVDDNGEIAQKYNVVSIPTVLVFKNGEVVDKMVGFRPKQDIVKLISNNL